MGNLKFYRDEPLFGLDIGHTSLKAMQIDGSDGKTPVVTGYGLSSFESAAVQNGVIVKPDSIAKAVHDLFEKNLKGSITSRRVACSIPTSKTFSRQMKVPPLDHAAIMEAIHLEAEQYIPIPTNSLYLDYEITHQDDSGMDILLVAASKNIIDSYSQLFEALSLEPVAFEPSINAASRLVQLQGEANEQPAIIVDLGSVTTDIAVFDKTLLVASTVSSGGDNMVQSISQHLHLTIEQASNLSSEFGIAYSDKQQRIVDAIKPQLEGLVREIEKSVRYYAEHSQSHGKITRIITVGGGSVMPGLNQYLSKELRLPTYNLDIWQKISFGKLTPPSEADLAMFSIVAGEALVSPTEILT
ncbi:MAG TPA: type IV pilus assembly protein PilM [Candidatus Saccharimonadales bacterium]|nr:type IV pilus assembly protein PilM [Candidatus Saccharimonadales bacterium]